MDKKIEKKGLNWTKILIYAAVIGGVGFLLTKIYKDAGTSRLNVETERLAAMIRQDAAPVTMR